jgi:hypothetical protein
MQDDPEEAECFQYKMILKTGGKARLRLPPAPTVPGTPVTGRQTPQAAKLWVVPIPLLGQYVLVSQILGGQWPGGLMLVASAIMALLLGLLCVWFTTRLFHRDKIIFGR